jgi:hypothetical protein
MERIGHAVVCEHGIHPQRDVQQLAQVCPVGIPTPGSPERSNDQTHTVSTPARDTPCTVPPTLWGDGMVPRQPISIRTLQAHGLNRNVTVPQHLMGRGLTMLNPAAIAT